MIQKLKFPQGFLWGAATAAHQIEGNNINSDWWAWENSIKRHNQLVAEGKNPAEFCSDKACDSYNRFDEDFAFAKELKHNATRLSVEWARIEPKEGVFDEKALEHYEKVLQSAKYHGLKTFVTLHHFTNPQWFFKKGEFTKKENLHYFLRYVKVVTKRLNDYTDFWLTINEPELYSTATYSKNVPQRYGLWQRVKVAKNLIAAHNQAANFIRLHLQKPVSMAYHLSDLQPLGILGGMVSGLAHRLANEYILSRTIGTCDFIGVNYYFHHHIGIFGFKKQNHSSHELTDMGFGIHPEGLERVLMSLKKYNKPIYITENGLADARDQKREKFIKDTLYYAHKAILSGADLRGYLHWSLMDNFEWAYGFGPRFGLIEIDREDLLRRRVRYSAVKYAEICATNELRY